MANAVGNTNITVMGSQMTTVSLKVTLKPVFTMFYQFQGNEMWYTKMEAGGKF